MDKKWLIKAGGRILGPYHREELVEKIKTREVVALDEVANAFGRWFYIRDSKEFGPVINSLKGRESSDELTQSLTGTPTEILGGPQDIGFGPKEKLSENLDSQAPPQPTTHAPSNLTTSEPYYQMEPVSKKRRSLQISFLAIAAFLAFLVYSNFQKSSTSPKQQSELFAKLYLEGEEAKRRGEYRRAIDLLKRAREEKPDNWEVVLSLAPLLIIDDESVLARRMLNSLLQSGGGESFRKRAHNLLALAEMKIYDYAKAEYHLDESIKLDRLFGPALVNRGIVHYAREEYDLAEKSFERAEQADLNDGVILLSQFLAVRERHSKAKDLDALKRLANKMENYVTKHLDYKFEIHIALAHLYTLMQQPNEAKSAIRNALKTDPELTANHVHDPRVYREHLNNEKILLMMASLLQDWPTKGGSVEPEVQTLNGLLIYKGQSPLRGRQIIENALSRERSNDLVRTVLSFVQMNSGLYAEADANITMATRTTSEDLAHLFAARKCVNDGNAVCVKDHVQTLERRDSYPLQVLTLKAWLDLQNQELQPAGLKVAQGLRDNPHYQPLLMLEGSLEALRGKN